MSLIQCPECKKEISDQSTVCINCGFPLVRDAVAQQVEITGVNITSSKNTKKIIITSILVIIAVVSILFAYKNYNKFELEKLIVKSFIEIESVASTAELTTSLTYQVWSSSIKSGSDFNNALHELYKRADMEILIRTISESKKSVESIYIKSLKFKDANIEMYKNYAELYDQFNKIVRFSISPEGSLQSYGQEKRKIFEDYRTLRDRLKPMLHVNIMTMSYWDWLKMKYFQF